MEKKSPTLCKRRLGTDFYHSPKQNMASKECYPIISYRVSFFAASFSVRTAATLRSLISWLIKRYYEIQYFSVVSANGEITMCFRRVRWRCRGGVGEITLLCAASCFQFSHVPPSAQGNEWAAKCALGKDKYRLYLFSFNDDDDYYYVFLFSFCQWVFIQFLFSRGFAHEKESIDEAKMLQFVSWIKSGKADKTFAFFNFFFFFISLFDELNRKSHHIKEPQILCIPFSSMEFDAFHSTYI